MGQNVDYDALAQQAGGSVDYDSLAAQAGAVNAQAQFAPPPGTPGVPRPQVNMQEESLPEALGGNDLEAVGRTGADYATRFGKRVQSNLQGVADAADDVVQHPEKLDQAMSVRSPHSLDNLEQNVKAQVPNYGLNRDTLVNAPADVATGAIFGMPEDKAPEPINDVVKGKYSRPADYLAASLRSNARIDVPAEAHIAHDAIAEGLADRGFTARDFQGRNGPAVLQSGIDRAIEIYQQRAESVISPIRGDIVDPQLLKENPELANQPEIANKAANGQPVTYGDIDNARVRMNKYLRRVNFYAKDPTAQVAADLEMEDAVNQARQALYGRAEAVTGHDLRPLMRTESALLKLKDLSNVTGNTLVGKDSRFQAESTLTKVGAKVKGLAAMKANPISSFFSYERMGESPLNEFNRNMQKSFANVTPQRANTKLPVAAGPAHPPVPTLDLTPPPGRVPPAGQEHLPFNEGRTQDMQTSPNGPLNLTGEGRVPAATQQDLNFNGADQAPLGSRGNPHQMPPSSLPERKQLQAPQTERRVTPRNGVTFSEAERQKFLERMKEVDRGLNPNRAHGVTNPFDRHPSHMDTVRNHEAADDILKGRKSKGTNIR